MRRRFPIVAAALLVSGALLAACDSGSGTGNSGKFVGNDSCPADGNSPYDPNPPATNDNKVVGQVMDEMPHTHVAPPAKIQFTHNPPTSGCHYSLGGGHAPIFPGVYPPSPVTGAEYWVHNLEHGYIVVLYKAGDDQAIAQLNAWYHKQSPDPDVVSAYKSGRPSPEYPANPYAKIVVTPWPSMDKPFACVSWDYYLGLDSLDLTQIQAFYDNHKGHTVETVNGVAAI